EAIEEVDRGPQTADDHLNAAVASDGTIHIAARRRTEQVGAPQLVLYSRRDGGWTKKAFAEKSVVASAGRPIILLTADPDPRRWVVYSSYLSLSGGGRTSQIHALEAMAG